MTRREDFATAVQRGRRAGHGSLVVHMAYASPSMSPRIGFVVSRNVGGSVVRHRVQRRLRHLMRSRLAVLPAGALVVVRALPPSAGATSAALGDDLDLALQRLIGTTASPVKVTAAAPGDRAAAHGGAFDCPAADSGGRR
jgi:ribonuclease P protein component